jgi:hypothetical protein
MEEWKIFSSNYLPLPSSFHLRRTNMTSKEVLERLMASKILSLQDYDVIQPIEGKIIELIEK